jgi:hypothetical protein
MSDTEWGLLLYALNNMALHFGESSIASLDNMY